MRKVILSDIGNVVVFFDNRLTLRAFARCSQLSEDEIHTLLFQGDCQLIREYSLGLIDTVQFRSMVMTRLGCLDRMTVAQFDQAYVRVFTLNSPVVRLWRKLSDTGTVITAVSDIEELRRQEVERLGVMSLFSHQVLSCEEGETKPSRRLIELALKRSGATAEQAVFIDDLPENLAPAAEIGVATHQYQYFSGLKRFLQQQGFHLG